MSDMPMMKAARGFAQEARLVAGDVVNRVRAMSPGARRVARDNMALRRQGCDLLNALSRRDQAPAYTRVLIDGMWDNPNYWTRYALLRAALGLDKAQEAGILGPFNRERVTASFDGLGITTLHDFTVDRRARARHRDAARRMADAITSADDAMTLVWPHGFPAAIAYDGVIRRQRRGDVDPDDPLLADHLAEALACLAAAERILDEADPELLVLSHAINFDFAALAWLALKRGTDVVVAYGNYGANRFLRIDSEEALYDFSNVPRRDQFDGVSPDSFDRLRASGRALMSDRLDGATDDLGAVYAFQRTRAASGRDQIIADLGLDPDKPLVCVYASNWFDFPHGAHMSHFRDFRDWIDATLEVACATPEVNWLFRPHPCDVWYGGVNGPTLADLVNATDEAHVRLIASDWNGHDLMRAVDAGITYFGTVAIELAASGKPALLADLGWYGHLGVAVLPESRAHYLDLLGKNWWESLDPREARSRAEAFAGWWFAMPDWLAPARLRDDSNQEDIWKTLPDWRRDGTEAIEREIASIRSWARSGERHLHVFRWLEELEGSQTVTAKAVNT